MMCSAGLLDLAHALEIGDRGGDVFDADAEQRRHRHAEQLGELLQRLDLGELAFLEAVERGARNAELAGDLVGGKPGAEPERLQPVADVVEAQRHAAHLDEADGCRIGGLLPLPLAGEGWGEGVTARSACIPSPLPSPASGRGSVAPPSPLSPAFVIRLALCASSASPPDTASPHPAPPARCSGSRCSGRDCRRSRSAPPARSGPDCRAGIR